MDKGDRHGAAPLAMTLLIIASLRGARRATRKSSIFHHFLPRGRAVLPWGIVGQKTTSGLRIMAGSATRFAARCL
jgi:hypothetical protein